MHVYTVNGKRLYNLSQTRISPSFRYFTSQEDKDIDYIKVIDIKALAIIVLREIIAQQTEMLTASQELSEQQSQDRRSNLSFFPHNFLDCSSVESLSNQTENVHKRSHYSHKYKTSDTSRIQHYSPFNSPSSSSATTRRYKETYRNTSKSTLKHTHHQSSKWNDRRQSSSALSPSSSAISPSSSPSLSSSSKHRTSSSEMNKSFHHDNDVVSPVHKKLKKHKKHSKHKHKHKSKK
ncbi:unnamed protein product [Schistosoma curassoni]|uniref:Cwf21 domain-containing protein n=1 Tax=Schistosoma curassoni TaxID=6186 RepID=A0A183KPM1_9TREM|nr:unnamed protein product [Schistosoma curassoni]